MHKFKGAYSITNNRLIHYTSRSQFTSSTAGMSLSNNCQKSFTFSPAICNRKDVAIYYHPGHHYPHSYVHFFLTEGHIRKLQVWCRFSTISSVKQTKICLKGRASVDHIEPPDCCGRFCGE